MHANNKHKSKKRSIILFSSIAIAVAVATFCILIIARPEDKEPVDTNKDTIINYSPPTLEEIIAGQNTKEKNGERNEEKDREPLFSIGKVFIVDATQYDRDVEVRAYVEDIFEDGGTCTFSFTKGREVITKTTSGFSDAAHTSCEPLIVPASEFNASGEWSLMVIYSSVRSTARSLIETVEVTR